jgi:hypothetical protein
MTNHHNFIPLLQNSKDQKKGSLQPKNFLIAYLMPPSRGIYAGDGNTKGQKRINLSFVKPVTSSLCDVRMNLEWPDQRQVMQ